MLQRRQGPGSPTAAPPVANEIPDVETPLPEPEPEVVEPEAEEGQEQNQPTTETEETQTAAPTEEAAASASSTAEPGAAGRTDIELFMPEPPTELSAAAQGRVNHARSQTNQAATVTTELPSAETNVDEARGAVEEPQEETQARAGEALVEALGERPQPSPEIEELCENIRRIIREKRPPDEESLVEADPEEAANAAGDQLNQSIEGDVERVEGSYNQLDEQPEGTPQQEPEEIETPPEQIETPDIGASEAIPDDVPAEEVRL